MINAVSDVYVPYVLCRRQLSSSVHFDWIIFIGIFSLVISNEFLNFVSVRNGTNEKTENEF